MLRDEADQMDCVLKINSGAGGNGEPGLGEHADAYVSANMPKHTDIRQLFPTCRKRRGRNQDLYH